MKSLYNFIITPFNNRYNNIKILDDKELIINTNIEKHEFVNKKAIVVETPAIYNTPIKKGDIVYVHHNIFRRYYDIRGNERNSGSFFKDDLYFCSPAQIYMYNLQSHLDYCFVKPILNTDLLKDQKEQLHTGIIKYSNKFLETLKITPGTLVTFTPNSEFEFIIEEERLYCMKSNDIALTHECKGDEEENNPSWTQSSRRINKSCERSYC